MKAEVGTICIFCQNPMHVNSNPHWIFDLEKAKLMGLAHATCRMKSDTDWYATKRTEWGEESPSEAEIEFGSKIARILQERKKRGFNKNEDRSFVYMLLFDCLWHTASIEDCLSLNKVNEHIDWWVNGSKIVSPQRAERIKQLLVERLKEEA